MFQENRGQVNHIKILRNCTSVNYAHVQCAVCLQASAHISSEFPFVSIQYMTLYMRRIHVMPE